MLNTEKIVLTKSIRAKLDDIIDEVRNLGSNRETSLVITKLEEASMWLGKHLHNIGSPNPYPHSKDPLSGDIVEPRELRN